MTSHDTRGSVTTLHDFGGVLGRPLGTFFWALAISWSRLLTRVRSGPEFEKQPAEVQDFRKEMPIILGECTEYTSNQ